MKRNKHYNESRGRLLSELAINSTNSTSKDCKPSDDTSDQGPAYQERSLSLGPEKQNCELISNCTTNNQENSSECVSSDNIGLHMKVSEILENTDSPETSEKQNYCELLSNCTTNNQENSSECVSSDNVGLLMKVSEIPENNTDSRTTPYDDCNISGSSLFLNGSAIIEIDDPELGHLIESQDFVLDDYIVITDNSGLNKHEPILHDTTVPIQNEAEVGLPINTSYRNSSPLQDIKNKIYNEKSQDYTIIYQNEEVAQRNTCPEVGQNDDIIVVDEPTSDNALGIDNSYTGQNEDIIVADEPTSDNALGIDNSYTGQNEDIIVADEPTSDNALGIDNSYTGRPKKGRKRKFESQNREIKKRKVNTNQDYVTCKGNIKLSKDFRDYLCNCRLKCNKKLSTEKREAAFNNFYKTGSYEARCLLIQSMVKEVPIKRKRVEGSERRTTSREYFLLNEKVCKNIFMQTLRISSCSINVALSKKKHASVEDGRGKAGGHNKLSNLKTEEVISHISKFPRYVSHYCRSVSKSEYLNPETTIPLMYKLYSEEHINPVSIASYKQIFYDKFNLKCKPLKKDTCNVCDGLVIQKKNSNSLDLKQKAEEEHKTHLETAEYVRKMMNDQFLKCKNEELKDTECISFDLEKTLPLPRIPTNIVFYKRQLWFYNCGVHDSKDRGFCYTWVEGSAGRGAQEIGSCLRKHILHHIPEGKKHLLLWSDSCGGQNKNIKIILMLKAVLEEHTTLEDITQHFLVSGHNFLRNDSDFSDIESCLKMQQRLYVPTDYTEVIKSCRKKNKLNVESMEKEDFVSTEQLEKAITNRKKSTTGEQVNWLKFRIIQVRKSEPGKIFVKSDWKQDNFVEINIAKQSKTVPKKTSKKCKQSVSPGQHINGEAAEEKEICKNFFSSRLTMLWPQGKPISKEKLVDLKSMFHLIPKDCQSFYRGLSSSEDIVDDIDGFSGALDFEPELS